MLMALLWGNLVLLALEGFSKMSSGEQKPSFLSLLGFLIPIVLSSLLYGKLFWSLLLLGGVPLTFSLLKASDSLNTMKWLNNLDSVPWSLRNFANHIEILMKNLKGWSCQHVLRGANSVADELAKDGVNRAQALVTYCDLLLDPHFLS